jgi:hypothetical protein
LWTAGSGVEAGRAFDAASAGEGTVPSGLSVKISSVTNQSMPICVNDASEKL